MRGLEHIELHLQTEPIARVLTERCCQPLRKFERDGALLIEKRCQIAFGDRKVLGKIAGRHLEAG